MASFAATIVKREQHLLLEHLRSRAQLLAASVDRVCANAIVAEEEQWTIVEQFQKMVDISEEVRYAVISKQSDGVSMVFTEKSWRVKDLKNEFWCPSGDREPKSFLHVGDLVTEEVLHYSYPFSYEGYDWGWIHVGMSLEEYRQSLNDVYGIIIMLAIPSLALSLGLSFPFARRLTHPIAKLQAFAKTTSQWRPQSAG